jgi:hypothetical protein
MATPSAIVEAICRMPDDFTRRGDVCMISLLKESGFLSSPHELTEQVLHQYIQVHPEVIDSWTGLSEDQRASECWYVLRPEWAESRGSWVVGFHPGGPRKNYSNGVDACAAFIKRYVDDLAKSARHAS